MGAASTVRTCAESRLNTSLSGRGRQSRLLTTWCYLAGATRGRPHSCRPGLAFALGQNLVLLRADGTKVYPPFLRWLVRGPTWWDQIGQFLNVGAVFDSLKCADVPNFRLRIPPLEEQRAIAHILGTLDDKIELNGRMNETLEAMVRALFKSWFVDFDPVRAKAEGRPRAPEASSPTSSAPAFENCGLGRFQMGGGSTRWGELVTLEYGKSLREYGADAQTAFLSTVQTGGLHHSEPLCKHPGIIIGRRGRVPRRSLLQRAVLRDRHGLLRRATDSVRCGTALGLLSTHPPRHQQHGLAVNDMFYLAVPMVASLFYEDVVAWLDVHEVRYTPR